MREVPSLHGIPLVVCVSECWDLNTSEVSLKKHLRTMNLSFDDPSLDNLDSSLSLHDPSDIDTALLSDIDGERSFVYTCGAGWQGGQSEL